MVDTAKLLTDEPSTTLKPWELQGIKRAHLLHAQLRNAIAHASSSTLEELRSIDFMGPDSPYMQQLVKLYREDLALAGLLDSSDLLMHAEGPAASDHNPRLNAVNWICTSAEKHIKHLLGALLPMALKDTRMAVKDLDLRLTGLVPGSLYAGFALAGTSNNPTRNLLSNEDSQTLDWLRTAMHALPVVPQFVGMEKLNREIMEALPDPALRDAAVVAAFEMSPTGTRGIHTLYISSPLSDDKAARQPQPLGQKERVVLREAIKSEPMMRHSKHGNFVGILRGIDLDTSRISIRNISNEISGLRGALMAGTQEAKSFLDKRVRIEGEYESNADGRPRMMRVEKIELAEQSLLTE